MGLLDTSLEIITYDCVDCKRTLPEEQYYWTKKGYRHSHSCKACYQLKRRGYQIAYMSGIGKEKARNRYSPEKRSESIVKSYGLTLDKYNQIVKVQGGGCAICGSKQAKTTITLLVKYGDYYALLAIVALVFLAIIQTHSN